MKKQRIIHYVEACVQLLAVALAWHYLPLWITDKFGVRLIAIALVGAPFLNFIFHEK